MEQLPSTLRIYFAAVLHLLLFVTTTRGAVDQNTLTLSSGNTEFALNLYNQIVDKANGGNIFMSPISVSTALAMTYAGTIPRNTYDIKAIIRQ